MTATVGTRHGTGLVPVMLQGPVLQLLPEHLPATAENSPITVKVGAKSAGWLTQHCGLDAAGGGGGVSFTLHIYEFSKL